MSAERRVVVPGRLRAPQPDRFGLVLALLVAAYVLFVLDDGPLARAFVAALYVAVLLVAMATSRPGGRLRLVALVVAVVGVVAVLLAEWLLPARDADGLVDCVMALVLLVTQICVLDRILTRQDVTLRMIAGAVAAYLLVGMFFAAVFGIVSWQQSGPFFAGGQPADAEALQYFSFTTLTTLGYGDLTALSSAGRGLAALEALVGQVFLATLIARLVGSFRRPPVATPPRPEAADPS